MIKVKTRRMQEYIQFLSAALWDGYVYATL